MQLESEVALSELTTLELGGCARHLVRARDESELVAALEYAEKHALPVSVIGGGSNVVVPDRGLDGLVILVRLRGLEFEPNGDVELVRARAGEPWDELVSNAVERGLAGVECLSGIPGLVGATPIQNVGAYGQEVSDTIRSVRAYDRPARRFVELGPAAIGFSYRDSLFKSREPNRYVVTEVLFALRPGGIPEIRYAELRERFQDGTPTLTEVRNAVLSIRRSKSMVIEAGDENRRSCGSFFLNPIVSPEAADHAALALGASAMPRFPQADGRVKLSAAWLIERSGLPKGTRAGNVGISSRHSLALVCHDGATVAELLSFAEHVQSVVAARTGVALHPEPVFL